MAKKENPKTCNLGFTKGTVYKDVRLLGKNAYRDIKLSLTMGTTADLTYYLKKYSTLLKDFDGNEAVEPLFKGSFSDVYISKNENGKKIVIKRSHDGLIPVQFGRKYFIPLPRWFAGIFFSGYDITTKSIRRDVYDYEKIVRPFWGDKRVTLEGNKFMPYLSMALHMDDHFLPEFTVDDLYSKRFWKKLLNRKPHKNLPLIRKYLRKIKTQKTLIPGEERYIFYDGFSKSLQTVFIQEAMISDEEFLPDRKMAFPFELVSSGYVPEEMPKLMLEQLLRAVESFVTQLDYINELKKVPDFRPLESWKVFPPTPFELFFAETNNLVVSKQKDGQLNISLVDTHLLMEPEGNLVFRWVEKRYWLSLFMNLRFWVRKALGVIE